MYRQLKNAYDGLHQNPNGLTRVNQIKAKMLQVQRHFLKAYERLNDRFVCGEKISAFQIGKRYRKRTVINSIQNQERCLTDVYEIENHLHEYFKDLYTAEKLNGGDNFPTNLEIPPDSNTNNAMMDEITTADIFFAIKGSASRKSPGSDGIPKEFYLKAFDIIHPQLNMILNETLRGNIPGEIC